MGGRVTIQVRDNAGTTVIDTLFERARAFRKSSQYPAGLYGSATFSLPRDPGVRASRLAVGQEVRVGVTLDNGHHINDVYHGYVESLEEIKRDGKQETSVTCTGAWGWIMERRGIERNWADTRLSQDAWQRDTASAGAEKATDDREDRIRITPKGVAWLTGEQYILTYQTPTGETVGKVTNAYAFAEAAQAWELALWNGSADEWSVTASGTGSQNVDLGTSTCQLYFEAKANQTPTEDGVYYGDVSSLVVYATRSHASATLGTVNVYQIALDVIDLLGVDETKISASLAGLDSTLTLSLEPFITKGWEHFGSILARAAGYGTSAPRKAVGFGLRPPFLAPDNLPLLFLESYPVTSAYDYVTSSNECDLSVRVNLDDIFNYIIVEYTNAKKITKTLTPVDDADLTDATSVSLYGTRIKKLVLPLANPTMAKNFGARYLARHKQPTYAVSQPVEVTRLRAYNGGWVPAAQIDAGKRLWISDLANLTGQELPSGTVFIITGTEYDHDRGTVQLSLGGRPDSLLIRIAQMELNAS